MRREDDGGRQGGGRRTGGRIGNIGEGGTIREGSTREQASNITDDCARKVAATAEKKAVVDIMEVNMIRSTEAEVGSTGGRVGTAANVVTEEAEIGTAATVSHAAADTMGKL